MSQIEMELVVPWKALLKVIEPHYTAAGRGRRPYPLEAMLRVHLMQNWFALSDPAMEEALYEITSLRTFAGLEMEPCRFPRRVAGGMARDHRRPTMAQPSGVRRQPQARARRRLNGDHGVPRATSQQALRPGFALLRADTRRSQTEWHA